MRSASAESNYERAEPTAAPQLKAEAHRYLAAVTQELALLDAGRVAASARVDRREVDPTFAQLQSRLDQIGATERRDADGAATATDLGVTASLVLAGLGLIVSLWRPDALRGAAARRTEQDLEYLALHDVLTGLPNRRKLLFDLEAEVVRANSGSGRRVVAAGRSQPSRSASRTRIFSAESRAQLLGLPQLFPPFRQLGALARGTRADVVRVAARRRCFAKRDGPRFSHLSRPRRPYSRLRWASIEIDDLTRSPAAVRSHRLYLRSSP
jgi:hypothetical protein